MTKAHYYLVANNGNPEGIDRVAAIKLIRAQIGSGLYEAKNIMDYAFWLMTPDQVGPLPIRLSAMSDRLITVAKLIAA